MHIQLPHGFNIGAAGQPPHCRNSLHSHRTAEVVFVLSGRWRFFWGRWGTAGEVELTPGDTMPLPEALPHAAVPGMTGEAALYHVVAIDDPAGPARRG